MALSREHLIYFSKEYKNRLAEGVRRFFEQIYGRDIEIMSHDIMRERGKDLFAALVEFYCMGRKFGEMEIDNNFCIITRFYIGKMQVGSMLYTPLRSSHSLDEALIALAHSCAFRLIFLDLLEEMRERKGFRVLPYFDSKRIGFRVLYEPAWFDVKVVAPLKPDEYICAAEVGSTTINFKDYESLQKFASSLSPILLASNL